MLRSVPRALDPGALPVFTCPQDVIDWVRAVDWLTYGDRSVVLHLDDMGRLSCVATTPGRLQDLSVLSRDRIAAETLDCGTSSAIGVDIRSRLPTKGPTEQDRRRHQTLRVHLAAHGVALLDTVIVAPAGGVSVTGALTPGLQTEPGGLRMHVPVRPQMPPVSPEQESASGYPPVRLLTPTPWPDDDLEPF